MSNLNLWTPCKCVNMNLYTVNSFKSFISQWITLQVWFQSGFLTLYSHFQALDLEHRTDDNHNNRQRWEKDQQDDPCLALIHYSVAVDMLSTHTLYQSYPSFFEQFWKGTVENCSCWRPWQWSKKDLRCINRRFTIEPAIFLHAGSHHVPL